jgi:hypothetical protein
MEFLNDALFASFLTGETSLAEDLVVKDWMERDENKRYMDGLQMIMEHSILPLTSGAEEQLAWEMLAKKMERPAIKNAAEFLLYKWVGAAAILLVLLATGFILERNNKNNKTNTNSQVAKNSRAIKLELHGNGIRTDTLPDGSVARLDKNSILYYPSVFDSSARSVQLKGSGYFSVTHHPQAPFRIVVGDMVVTDVGTSFIIHSDSEQTSVDVLTGAVEIIHNRKHQSLLLRAGEKISVHITDTIMRKLTTHAVNTQVPDKKIAESGLAEDPRKLKKEMRSILNDIISMHLRDSRKSIEWFGLTSTEFMINGQKQKPTLQQKFAKKYHVKPDNGFFYGPVKMIGNGFFLTKKELNE